MWSESSCGYCDEELPQEGRSNVSATYTKKRVIALCGSDGWGRRLGNRAALAEEAVVG